MATLDPRGEPGRPFRFPGTISAYIRGGRIVARGMPRHVPASRRPIQLWWQEWFRQANLLAKYADHKSIITSRESTAGTPWGQRDMLLAAMRGRLWSIGLSDGRTLYPMAAVNDVSKSLDVVAQVPGSILVRTASIWTGLPPGPADYVLTSTGPGSPPIWAPSSGGGSAYRPPVLSEWPS